MTDKEKIKAEIERQIPLHICGYQNALKDILKFIDSIPKETVGADFDAEWKNYFKYKGDMATVNIKDLARHFVNWQKEQLIDKACEWLYQQQLVVPDMEKFIEDFCKAMDGSC